ncbi:MAG TPA: Tad domain-containing protein [Anaerolineales bacterium]
MIPPRQRHERGQALILIVFGIVALFGIAGLAIDGGNVYADRRQAQNAADGAALAAALARINGEDFVNAAIQVAKRNGYGNDGIGSAIGVHSPPTGGSEKGNIEYIEVTITSNVRTPFAAVVGRPRMTNIVRAVARSKPAMYKPIFDGAAVVSLAASSDCDNNKSAWVHAEATLSLEGGGMFINSNNPTCALIQQANGSIRIDGDYPLQLVGGYHVAKPHLITPFPPQHASQEEYPPPFVMPKVGCGDREARISDDGTTMSPGNWGDPFPPPGVSVLQNGVYCLDGDFIMNTGFLSGGSVTIYVKNGQMHLGGGAVLDLKAPKTGKLAGLLIYQPPENPHLMALNAGPGSIVIGTILAPGAEIRIKGSDDRFGFHSQIVGYTINADGDSNVIIRYVDEQNYDALYMPEVQLAQ